MENRNLIAIGVAVTSVCGLIATAYIYTRHKSRTPKLRDVSTLSNASWDSVGKVKELLIYPIKSCGGLKVSTYLGKKVGPQLGPYRDRSFLVVDEQQNMVTARKCASMVKIQPELDCEKESMTLHYEGKDSFRLQMSHLDDSDLPLVKARVHDDFVPGVDCGDEVAQWMSSVIGKPNCRLVYHRESLVNRTIPLVQQLPLMESTDGSLYADLSGWMLMTTASVQDLQSKVISRQIDVQDFRPNILVENTRPFVEDHWTYIKIGRCIFRNIKPCSRCIFTTIDHHTGKRDPNMEPLKTLKKYRMIEDEACMGINLGLDIEGSVSVGQEVYVLRD